MPRPLFWCGVLDSSVGWRATLKDGDIARRDCASYRFQPKTELYLFESEAGLDLQL